MSALSFVASSARRRGTAPDAPCGLVLVLRAGTPAGAAALAAARTSPARADGVTVVVPLKVHGYALGLPNPGLLPNARERAAAERAVAETVRRLRSPGLDVDGQITITRDTAKAVGRIVRRRRASTVIVEQAPTGRLRSIVEGDLGRQIRRRVRGRAVVQAVPAPAGGAAS